jgi:hypothetical protein
MKDLLYKKANNLTIRIASPILELPFKAHNSYLIGESESERDRLWSINLGNIDFSNTSIHEPSLENKELDEYERF